jgi:hypothetical protein
MKVQALRPVLADLAPGLPGGEEIQAEAEAGFEEGEALAAEPSASGKVVAGEEDMAGLRKAAVLRCGRRRRKAPNTACRRRHCRRGSAGTSGS